MIEINVNIWAVLVSSLILMVLGFLWYGPVFGKTWMKLSGITVKDIEDAKSQMSKTYALSTLGALVIAFVLAYFVQFMEARSAISGAMMGFWIWLGFVATTMLNSVLYESKSLTLYVLNTGYYLVALPVMGAILAVWS